MISRERLIAGLQEVIYVEEGMVTMFTKFSEGLLAHAEDIDDVTKGKIKKILHKLHSDSTRHKAAVEGIARRVEAGGRSEY
ncbi:MAG: hypothetical protein PHH49_01850 [Candidatus Omnitrophica bacterium]|nr:hypothetical protein [Candidatus Omnitrophota bacterium]MDD5487689.1 hypothetical protein [Candidatus Omnitrophota bacterium]